MEQSSPVGGDEILDNRRDFIAPFAAVENPVMPRAFGHVVLLFLG